MENKIILIAPWAKSLRNGANNPKNYPWWTEVVNLLKLEGFYIIQVGLSEENDIGANERKSNLSLEELETLIKNSFTCITVDSFFQHYCWYIGNSAIVLWGKSDPIVFGHESNINLLKDRKYLRSDPFRWWEDINYDPNVFVSPETVLKTVKDIPK